MRLKTSCHFHAYKLLNAITGVVAEKKCDCISLSGGIDTSVVAVAAATAGLKPRAYVVAYESGLPKDLYYADHVSRFLGLELKYVIVDRDKAMNLARKVTDCFGKENLDSHGDGGCIEMRNDVVFYAVLEETLKDGCSCVFLGSGGDELFAGYSFMLELTSSELEEAICKMIRGRFPELQIADCIGAKAVAPLLDERVVNVATTIPMECLRGIPPRGKEVLRYILEEKGLWEIAERHKAPAEEGSGTKSLCVSIYDR
ncbi:MAG: asparagine synthase-related protein [Fervidicoccaceae archaeon]